MSKYFNRIKQQATEFVSRSNTLTTIPQDIQQCQNKVEVITKNKNDLVEKMKMLTYDNGTFSITTKNVQPLIHISNTWQTLIESIKSMNFMSSNDNDYKNIEFISRCNESIKHCGEYQLEFAEDIKRDYIGPNSEYFKGPIKEYKMYSEKLNHCRLDIDSEKAKHAKSNDPYKKERHADNIAILQKKFDDCSYIIKRLMEPICDPHELSEREMSDISSFCRLLKGYYEKCLNELNRLQNELNFQSIPKYQGMAFPRTEDLLREIRTNSISSANSLSSLNSMNSLNNINSSAGNSLTVSPSLSRGSTSPVLSRGINAPPLSRGSTSPIQSRGINPPSLPNRPVPKLPQCRAMYNFEGVQPGDLSFKKGDIITLIKSEGSWWKGTINGVSGDFPSNYVQKI